MPATAGRPEKFTEVRWQEFMSEPRGLYILGQALTDPRTFDKAAKRILQIILTPDAKKLPFPSNLEWEKNGMLNEALRRKDQWLDHLSRQNTEQAAVTIGENLDGLKEEKSPDADISRRQLINLIPFVIPKVSDKSASRLLEQFDINAWIFVLDGSHAHKIFDPLANLFVTAGVKDVWKMAIARDQVHPQIEAEKPKKGIDLKKIFDGERLTFAERYAGILDRSLEERQLEPGNFVEELAFLIHNTQFLNRVLPVFSGNFFNIMDVCMQVDPQTGYDLFEAFVRRKLFTVGYEKAEVLAKKMLDYYLYRDNEITTYILEQLKDYSERKTKNMEYRENNDERQRQREQRINAIRRRQT